MVRNCVGFFLACSKSARLPSQLHLVGFWSLHCINSVLFPHNSILLQSWCTITTKASLCADSKCHLCKLCLSCNRPLANSQYRAPPSDGCQPLSLATGWLRSSTAVKAYTHQWRCYYYIIKLHFSDKRHQSFVFEHYYCFNKHYFKPYHAGGDFSCPNLSTLFFSKALIWWYKQIHQPMVMYSGNQSIVLSSLVGEISTEVHNC